MRIRCAGTGDRRSSSLSGLLSNLRAGTAQFAFGLLVVPCYQKLPAVENHAPFRLPELRGICSSRMSCPSKTPPPRSVSFTSRIQRHLNFAIHHASRERARVELRPLLVQVPASPQAESPVMNPTTNNVPFKRAMRQRGPRMRTLITDSPELTVNVKQPNHLPINNEQL